MRVVVDTNVLISAIFWTGKPKQILNKVRREEIKIDIMKVSDFLDYLKRGI